MKSFLLYSWISLCASDSVTTHYALSTHRFHETVLPVQNPYALDGMNAAQCTAVAVAGVKLPKKLGIPVLLVGIAARGWAVSHNLRELHR